MPTAAQALDDNLPQVRGSGSGSYKTTHSSGRSTDIARVPKTIIAFGDNELPRLQSPKLTTALSNTPDRHLIEAETSFSLETEGDIERSSALYLLHDVNRIIEQGLLPLIPGGPNNLKCLGQSTTGNSRPDIKYTVNDKTVLIVEYKSTNALRKSDWDNALVTPTRTAQQVISSIPVGGVTALLDNAGILSKQASKYSGQCGVVVLFNYQYMIVLDFKTRTTGPPWDDLNAPVKYYFSDGRTIKHRRLLMNAFVYGLRKAGFIGATD